MGHEKIRATTKPICFGVIVSSRLFFNAGHAVSARADILDMLKKKGMGAIIGGADLTPNGAVASLKDAEAYAKLFKSRRDEIDGIIVVLANFGDEIAVAETIRMANLGVPVLVQACPDELGKLDVRGRRDAYCGKISVCNNLKQYGIAWTDTTSHVSSLASEEFSRDLADFAKVCRVVGGVRGARIGAIGARPAAFQTVRFSEKILQAAGATVVTVDLSEIIAAAEAVTDEDAARSLEGIRAYGRIPPSIPEAAILKQAKFTLAVERWVEDNGCDASAVQCWESIQKNYGCASCLTMSMMGERLLPSACEVDVTGALSMLVLALASQKSPGFLDWNNNYADREDLVVGTHCSNFPKSFLGVEPEISNLDILGETLGRERCFGAVKGKVAPGPFTFFRASTDDTRGNLACYFGEGEFTADPFPMDGGIAVCKITETRRLLSYITRNGFEHHVSMVRGEHGSAIREAVERYLGWSFYDHSKTRA